MAALSNQTNQGGQAANQARFAGKVFLTGVTGFLGAHLLVDLLEHTEANIACLARGADQAAAHKSLTRQLSWYFPGFDLAAHGERVHVVRGDMEAPELGLARDVYESLAETQDVILNAAADVNHVGAASRSFRVNTEAVATLIGLAKRGRSKAFHHVSTVSVRGEFKGPAPLASFKETHLEEGQSFHGAYQESKYRAEVLLRKAFAEGLTGGVYRVGYVGPHSVTGRYQRNIQQSNTARYVRACVRLGFVPYAPADTVQLTPVDSVARAIVLLMTRGSGQGQTYYVESPQLVLQYDVLRVLHAAGYPVRLMSEAEFLEKAPRLSQDAESLSAITPPPPDADEGHPIPTDASWSQRELRKLGFEYPRLTSAWLGRFLSHAIEVGFVEAPRFWNVAAPIGDLI
jgi:thioester reductase-like protein